MLNNVWFSTGSESSNLTFVFKKKKKNTTKAPVFSRTPQTQSIMETQMEVYYLNNDLLLHCMLLAYYYSANILIVYHNSVKKILESYQLHCSKCQTTGTLMVFFFYRNHWTTFYCLLMIVQ